MTSPLLPHLEKSALFLRISRTSYDIVEAWVPSQASKNNACLIFAMHPLHVHLVAARALQHRVALGTLHWLENSLVHAHDVILQGLLVFVFSPTFHTDSRLLFPLVHWPVGAVHVLQVFLESPLIRETLWCGLYFWTLFQAYFSKRWSTP